MLAERASLPWGREGTPAKRERRDRRSVEEGWQDISGVAVHAVDERVAESASRTLPGTCWQGLSCRWGADTLHSTWMWAGGTAR